MPHNMTLRSYRPLLEGPEPSQVLAPLTRDAGAFDFLLLPYDIRKSIYKILLVNAGKKISLTPTEFRCVSIDENGLPFGLEMLGSSLDLTFLKLRSRKQPSNINILYACKTTCVQDSPVLYGQNDFLIYADQHSGNLFKHGGQESLQHLARLRIDSFGLRDMTNRYGPLSIWKPMLRSCPDLKTITLTTRDVLEDRFVTNVVRLARNIADCRKPMLRPELIVRARVDGSKLLFLPKRHAPEDIIARKTHPNIGLPSTPGCKIVYTGIMDLQDLLLIAKYESNCWKFKRDIIEQEMGNNTDRALVELTWVEQIGRDRADKGLKN